MTIKMFGYQAYMSIWKNEQQLSVWAVVHLKTAEKAIKKATASGGASARVPAPMALFLGFVPRRSVLGKSSSSGYAARREETRHSDLLFRGVLIRDVEAYTALASPIKLPGCGGSFSYVAPIMFPERGGSYRSMASGFCFLISF
ncbi:hypothetical protein YC2023_104674 [Brassica napus]